MGCFQGKEPGCPGLPVAEQGYCRPGPNIYMGAPIGVLEIHLQLEIVVSIEV